MIPIISNLYKKTTAFTDENGDHWFDATSVIKCTLKYKSSVREVLRRVDPVHKKLVTYDELKKIGGRIEKSRTATNTYPRNFISIPGICGLLLASRALKHKEFQGWIVSKVVPAIIRDGLFVNSEKLYIKNNSSIWNKFKKRYFGGSQ